MAPTVSDHKPAGTLTEEQRERIATNKAAALARLAKARSLAAWASQPVHFKANEGSQQTASAQKVTAHISLSSKLSVLVRNDEHTMGQIAQQGQGSQASTAVTGHCQVAPNGFQSTGPKPIALTGREAVAIDRVVGNSGVEIVKLRCDLEGHADVGESGQLLLGSSTDGWLSPRVRSVGVSSVPSAPQKMEARGRENLTRPLSEALQSDALLTRTCASLPALKKCKAGNSPIGANALQKTQYLRSPAPPVVANGVGLSGGKLRGVPSPKQYVRPSGDGAAKAALEIFASAGLASRSSGGQKALVDVQKRTLRAEWGPQSAADFGPLEADRGPTKPERGLPDTFLGPLAVCSKEDGVVLRMEKEPSTLIAGAESNTGGEERPGVGALVCRTCSEVGTGMGNGSLTSVAVGAVKAVEKKGPFLQWPRQEFEYFLVIDFECTCDNKPFDPAEIIEFPSVLLNARTLRIEDSFRVFCRPQVHSMLTPFCTSLTGIRQDQVDAGVSLQEALAAHDTWLRSKNLLDKPNRFAVVTWTDWDCKVMLEMECKWKRIQKPAYFNRWVNLKLPFAKVFPKAKGTCHGLRGHVTYAGVTWEGRAHSGLDDATNTARLAAALIRQGGKLTITDSFKIYAADGSKVERVLRKRPLVQADGNAREGPVANGKCHCGVKRKRRTVKKPGPTHGQTFFSCGKWTITGGGCCEYFEWVQDGDCK